MALTRRALRATAVGALSALAAALLAPALWPTPEGPAPGVAAAPMRSVAARPLQAWPQTPVLETPPDGPSPSPRQLRGRVEDDAGVSIPGARVAARPRGGGPVCFSETDAWGAFALAGLPNGELELVAVAEGWPVPTPRVVDPDEDELVLRLQRLMLRGAVRGVVPCPDLRVDAVSAAEGRTLTTAVAAASFELALPSAGEWWVRASQRGAASPWVRVVVTGAERLELTLEAEVEVTAAVQGPDGEPLAAQVELRDPVGRALRVRTDPGGRVVLPAIPGEAYTLVASVPGLAPAVRELVAPAEVVLALEDLVRVRVSPFLARDRQPVRGTLTIDPAPRDPHDHPDASLPFEVRFDDQGAPELQGLPPGVWQLSFLEPAPDELRAWVLEVDTDAPAPLTFDGQGPRSQVAGRVLARLPQDELVQVELRPAGSPGGAFQFLAARAAGADGGFAFEAVPPGDYTLHADWGAGTARSEPFTVVLGRPAWVEVSE